MSQEKTQLIEVKIPDIGDFKDVPVIEVMVKAGDTIAADDPLLTLESDKATIEVPAPAAGTIKEIKLKVGDKVMAGTLVLTLETSSTNATESTPMKVEQGTKENAPEIAQAPPQEMPQEAISTRVSEHTNLPSAPSSTHTAAPAQTIPATLNAHTALPTPAELAAEMMGGHKSHASPSVRRFARELGVDVTLVNGTGPKGRILQTDVQSYVKQALVGAKNTVGGANSNGNATNSASLGGLSLLPWPNIDFTKFGPIETKPLSRIQKISGANLARNWVMIPHVTQFDDADITELEALRVQLNKENEKAGIKLTLLAFLIKAAVAALKKYPDFNVSLDVQKTEQGEEQNLIYKQYFHIGFAAETPNGLVVPVIRDADKKGVIEIAKETSALATKAREGKLSPTDMQGGCFSISSLGGIGGTAFTPIINAPEVAILGVSKSIMKPVWDGHTFVPRLTVPLSLSYDHRVIDGAAAARFTHYLGQLLADMRRTLL